MTRPGTDVPRPRRTRLWHEAGPYQVTSAVDGTLTIRPQWAGYEGKPGHLRQTPEDHAEAGGPGMISRMSLAAQLEYFLNWPWLKDALPPPLDVDDRTSEGADGRGGPT